MSQAFWNRFTAVSFVRLCARSVTVGALLCSASLSFAQQSGKFDEDYDDEEKPWQEIALQLPPAPQTANLAEFYVGPTTTSVSAIDLKSLTVGSDDVVRYTMVTKASGGAINTSYEGIRCTTAEMKSYAFGRSDGSWSRSRQNKWKQITDIGANRQEAALYKDYFCQGGMLAGKAEQMIERLRNKRSLDLSTNR